MGAAKGNQNALGNRGGHPPKYKDPEEMQRIIDDFFESCRGEVLKDKDGETVFNKFGEPVIINQKPPTVTGLSLALGFNGRQSLLNYEDKVEFMDTVTRAKSRCQEYAEIRLYDRDGANGAKFSLQNNFGWKERSEVDQTTTQTITIRVEDTD